LEKQNNTYPLLSAWHHRSEDLKGKRVWVNDFIPSRVVSRESLGVARRRSASLLQIDNVKNRGPIFHPQFFTLNPFDITLCVQVCELSGNSHTPAPLQEPLQESMFAPEMKWLIWTIAAVVVISMIGIIVFRQKSILPPSVMGEFTYPGLISDEAWRQSVAENPAAHGYSAYGILQKRGSDIAIEEGLRDLTSEDAYVWVNAASYIGSRGHSEAVPYLIKAIRHTAWRAADERVVLLQQLTRQTFGDDFEQWRRWYESQPDAIDVDWDSSLGSSPRLSKPSRGQNADEKSATHPDLE